MRSGIVWLRDKTSHMQSLPEEALSYQEKFLTFARLFFDMLPARSHLLSFLLYYEHK